MPLGGEPYGDRVEPGAFEQHRLRAAGYSRLLAPHDAGQGHRPFGVGDDQSVFGKFPLLFVECAQGFAVPRPPHDDFLLPQTVEVEGMKGMAQFHQHVVRHIGDIVDGPNPDRFQTLCQPSGRGSDANISDHSCAVPVAEFRIGNLDGSRVAGGAASLFQLNLERFQTSAPGGGKLPRHAVVVQAVGAVGGDFNVEENPVAARLDGFHIETDIPQLLRQLLRRGGNVDEFFKPLEGYFHRSAGGRGRRSSLTGTARETACRSDRRAECR